MSETQLTRSGIAYNLEVSPHKLHLGYSVENVTYIFSSNFYLTKFLKKIEQNRNEMNQALSKRYGFNVKMDELCDIKLYSKIEKRGFLIETDKERFTCLSSITLDGEKLMNKS